MEQNNQEEDEIFDIIHSLPTITHSVAIAGRTPTASYQQKSKYIPDYGGVLEIPNSNIKNNSMTTKLPHYQRPGFALIPFEGLERAKRSQFACNSNREGCLVASQYFDTPIEDSFPIISAAGPNLYFDYCSRSDDDEERQYSIKNYAHVEYNDDIASIKHSEALPDLLIVKNDRCIKTINLNSRFQIQQYLTDQENRVSSQQEALTFGTTIRERRGLYVKDACVNQFNRSIVTVASEDVEQRQVKVYDLNTSSRFPVQTIEWSSLEQNSPPARSAPTETPSTQSSTMGPVTRSFIPMGPASHGIQQIDKIPSHLVNMIVTTAYQTALIDPRIQGLAKTLVKKMDLPSFYPIELIRCSVYSKKNPYQFYSLSNVHLRAFDTRYLGIPMNQANHMLDSEYYDSLNMKLINYTNEELETVCCSAKGNLAFLGFDQSQLTKIVNPKSVHLPYHCPDPTLKLSFVEQNPQGLAVLSSEQIPSLDQQWLFSVIHFTEDEILLREFDDTAYESPDTTAMEVDSQATELIIEHGSIFRPTARSQSSPDLAQVNERDVFEIAEDVDVVEDDDSDGYINVLDGGDSIFDFEDRFSSNRAIEMFERMQQKLVKPNARR